MPILDRNEKITCDVGHKLQRRTWYDTRDVQLEHFIELNVPTFQQHRRLI